MVDDPAAGVPAMAFVAFQAMFACLTVGLIAGAIADRAKFGSWLVFAAVWALLVYFPVAHWVFNLDPEVGGWIYKLGVIDFAGGTAVHINAGAAGLALAIVLGTRLGWRRTPMRPHNLTLTMVGAGLLWFGWFGFNAGSAFDANGTAIQAFMNTFLAAAAAGLAWGIVERIRDGHFTNLGVASGIVAGLVAITPGAGYVSGMSPIWIGLIAGVLCSFAVQLKFKGKFDDSLDVVGVHFVGGLIGSILIGLFADPAFFGGEFAAGLLNGGGVTLLVEQLVANIVTIIYSFIVTGLILLAIKAIIGIRVSEEDEEVGLDLTQHAESAYNLGDATMVR